jgi:aerobic-type carbon monoxide dehydrogenase small subunit (CoxS/CutS family)
MTTRHQVTLTVNGKSHTGEVESRKTLADFLREDLGLTGTHLGCEHGVCGACTIIVDGAAVRSCLMLAVQADGAEVRTVEGLATDGRMHPVQQGMWECQAFQCGFCTPGFLMTVAAHLEEHPEPSSREEIREMLSGNICRCSGYQAVVDGVERAAALITSGEETATLPTPHDTGGLHAPAPQVIT